MTALVNAHGFRFRVEGEIPTWLLDELRKRCGGGLRLIEQAGKRLTPGGALRLYREERGMTQEELGKKLGPGLRKQHISNMESGIRGISKAMAKKLAKFFSAPVERFI